MCHAVNELSLRLNATCLRSPGQCAPPRTGGSPTGPRPVSSPISIAQSSTGSAPQANWAGHWRSWTQCTFGRKGRHPNRSQSSGSRQTRLQAAYALQSRETPLVVDVLRSTSTAAPSSKRWSNSSPSCDPHAVHAAASPRSPAPTKVTTSIPPSMAERAKDRVAHRPHRSRRSDTTQPPPMHDRTYHRPAHRITPINHPLRSRGEHFLASCSSRRSATTCYQILLP